MRFPEKLKKGDKIGITAPSMGVSGSLIELLDGSINNFKNLGFYCIETPSVRKLHKGTSTTAKKRAEEFMDIYFNDDVKAIIAARGGEFLMDMLPYLDYEKISNSTPKWILGFSDISTLLLTLALKCDLAGAHGPLMIHFSDNPLDESTLNALHVLQGVDCIEQSSIGCYDEDYEGEPDWLLLGESNHCEFSGRFIGGGLDTIRSLIGTPFAPVKEFIEKYKEDGVIWYFESCEMEADDIYKTLWQMKMNGWFNNCKGVLYGRPDGYCDFLDFTLEDALTTVFSEFNIPVLYNVDIGHIPPQLTIVNGALATIGYKNSKAKVIQKLM